MPLELVERKVGIRQRRRAGAHGVRQRANAGVRELQELEGRVLQGTGLWDEPIPEIDPHNDEPRVTVPTLIVNGRYDFWMPYETAQQPLFELLGVQAEHKHHVALESGHTVPPADRAGVILPWLDRYLGPAR